MKKAVFVLAVLILCFNKSEGQTLLIKNHKHIFSDALKPDIFRLSLIGRSVLKSKVTFQIFNHNGKQIFKEEFPAHGLLYGTDEKGLTSHKQIDTIKKRFNHFFDERGFRTPAIKLTDKFYTDNADIKTWNDIRADRKAIGFMYAHGYEGTYGIAWSKTRKKVVRYFYSD